MDLHDDDEMDVHQFGWWPEIVGAAGVAALVWFLITFARGTF